MRRAGWLALTALALAACSSGLPKGVTKERLDAAISQAIGDPNTCVLIAKQDGGHVVYRYNSHAACDQKLPACDAPRLRTVSDLLRATAREGQARALSCDSSPDGSRGVGWASGVIAGKRLVYAAVMEGDRGLPGRIIAAKLDGAFHDAGL